MTESRGDIYEYQLDKNISYNSQPNEAPANTYNDVDFSKPPATEARTTARYERGYITQYGYFVARLTVKGKTAEGELTSDTTCNKLSVPDDPTRYLSCEDPESMDVIFVFDDALAGAASLFSALGATQLILLASFRWLYLLQFLTARCRASSRHAENSKRLIMETPQQPAAPQPAPQTQQPQKPLTTTRKHKRNRRKQAATASHQPTAAPTVP